MWRMPRPAIDGPQLRRHLINVRQGRLKSRSNERDAPFREWGLTTPIRRTNRQCGNGLPPTALSFLRPSLDHRIMARPPLACQLLCFR
jgi:hypothetical protein